MIYGSWNKRCNKQKFLLFWAMFCPFSPLTTWKIKIWELKKNPWRYYYFIYLHHKWQSYDVWFLRYGAWRTEFFVTLDHFLYFYPPNNPKNQNFEKIKKSSGGIIILHKCTLNDNYIMSDFWGMTCNGWSYFGPFLPYYSPDNPKNQIFEKMKISSGDIIILHKCTKNHNHMLYCSFDMTLNGCNFYFSFWAIFCPFTNLTPRKIRI